MSENTVSKWINLDSIYLLGCIFLLFLIKCDNNLVDVIYLFIVTFYYFRIKIYRRLKSHNL